MNIFKLYLLLFILYSFLGFIVETIYCFIMEKKLVNRGFLIGPYCPIYGAGIIFSILLLNAFKNNMFLLFLLGVILCSIIEYLTSYCMEKIFNARWWDYSREKFNLNGRITLKNSILFGLGVVVVLKGVNPFVMSLVLNMKSMVINIIFWLSLILILTDFIVSFKVVSKLNNFKLELNEDNTGEIKRLVKEFLLKNNLIKRLVLAFPNLSYFNGEGIFKFGTLINKSKKLKSSKR